MKTAVLVPSHIYYPGQLARLEKCLDSLIAQTIIPDVLVSISFGNDTYRKEFSSILCKHPTIKFLLSAQQKFQMEHLYTLSLLVTDYDMIMFCDDDDTYHPFRVEAFEYTFQELIKTCQGDSKHFGGVREVINKDFYTSEYWAYGIRPSLLTEFFTRVKGYEDLMRHKFADMYLRDYLRKTGGKSMLFGIVPPDATTDRFYNYTIDNPNSICSRHQQIQETAESANELIEENVRLALICARNDLVKDYMRDACAPMSRLREVVPDAEKIQRLTKLLYI